MPEAPQARGGVAQAQAPANCREQPGAVARVVDRDRGEGKAECVGLWPYGVFEIRRLVSEERAGRSLRGKLKAWAHGWKQANVAHPESCRGCRLCVQNCPEQALALRPLQL